MAQASDELITARFNQDHSCIAVGTLSLLPGLLFVPWSAASAFGLWATYQLTYWLPNWSPVCARRVSNP